MNNCALCGKPVNPYESDTWKEVIGWVGGPRKDSMRMRENTGRYAHHGCIKTTVVGLPPKQEDLFDESNADVQFDPWRDRPGDGIDTDNLFGLEDEPTKKERDELDGLGSSNT